jgi:hypothetical protein
MLEGAAMDMMARDKGHPHAEALVKSIANRAIAHYGEEAVLQSIPEKKSAGRPKGSKNKPKA